MYLKVRVTLSELGALEDRLVPNIFSEEKDLQKLFRNELVETGISFELFKNN